MSKTKSGSAKTVMLSLLTGMLAGALIMALLVKVAMPGMMLSVHKSRFQTVDQTCSELKASIERQGWNCPAVRNLNKSMQKEGVSFPRPVRIVELCQAEYAAKALSSNPEVATMMPCAYGVYQGTDGAVYISSLNMGLLGKMFGGTIAEVMGVRVAADERRILAGVIAD